MSLTTQFNAFRYQLVIVSLSITHWNEAEKTLNMATTGNRWSCRFYLSSYLVFIFRENNGFRAWEANRCHLNEIDSNVCRKVSGVTQTISLDKDGNLGISRVEHNSKMLQLRESRLTSRCKHAINARHCSWPRSVVCNARGRRFQAADLCLSGEFFAIWQKYPTRTIETSLAMKWQKFYFGFETLRQAKDLIQLSLRLVNIFVVWQ